MAESCGPDYSPHLRPLEQDSFAPLHTHTHDRYRITCVPLVRYVILLTRSTGNTEHLCLLLLSFLFKFLCLFLVFLPPLVL